MPTIVIVILLILLFGGGFSYWGHANWGPTYGAYAGPGIGLGTILVILLICYLLGMFR